MNYISFADEADLPQWYRITEKEHVLFPDLCVSLALWQQSFAEGKS